MCPLLGCQIKHSIAYYPIFIGSRSCRKTEPFIKDKPSSLRRTVSATSQLTLGPPCFMQHPQTGFIFSLASQLNFVFGGPVCLLGECFQPQADASTPTHDYISIFSKYIDNLTYHQSRATHRHSDLDFTLFTSQRTTFTSA